MKTILFPTDFSAGAENAFNYTVSICGKAKAKLILFNSFHIPIYTPSMPMNEDTEKHSMKMAKDQLLRLQNNALIQSKNLDVKTVASCGLAVDNIIQTAEEKKADLIIMGTKGASGLKEIFIGSNAAAVLEKASCPVLVIPEKAKFKNIDKIVFATDFGDSDFDFITSLTQIAKLFKSEIMIVHVSQVRPVKDYEKDLLQWYKKELKEKVNVAYKKISFHNLVGGNVDYELEDFIEKNKVDLLALSMRKRNVFSKLFEPSLSRKMVYHSHTPLLAFHASK